MQDRRRDRAGDLMGGDYCPARHHPRRDDSDVAAVLKQTRLADFERVVGPEDDGNRAAQQPNVDRSVDVGDRSRDEHQLRCIRRIDDDEVGHHRIRARSSGAVCVAP